METLNAAYNGGQKMQNMETVAHLGDLAAVPLLEAALGLHEGRVLVPGVVVGEVRVGGGSLGGRGGCGCCCCCCGGGGGLGGGGGGGGLVLGEVDGNLDISQRVLTQQIVSKIGFMIYIER